MQMLKKSTLEQFLLWDNLAAGVVMLCFLLGYGRSGGRVRLPGGMVADFTKGKRKFWCLPTQTGVLIFQKFESPLGRFVVRLFCRSERFTAAHKHSNKFVVNVTKQTTRVNFVGVSHTGTCVVRLLFRVQVF